jgi:hypothetical protein
MPPHDDEVCTCVTDLDKMEIVTQYAEKVACDFVDDFGGSCRPMFQHVVAGIMVRFAHLAVLSNDENVSASERKTLDAVEAYLIQLSKTAPAALKVIMDDAERRENPSASH